MDLQQKKAAILDALLEHGGVEHVLSAASRVLGNPILMVDRLGTYTGLSRTEEFGDSYWARFNEALPFEQVIKEVEEKGIAERLMQSDAVLLEHFDHYERDVYGTRVRDRVDILGYVSMVLERPREEDDDQLMVALARMLAVELVYQSQHVSWRDEDSELVQELLSRRGNEELSVVARARGIGDGHPMRLICVCFAPSEEVSVFFAKSSLDMNVDCLLCGAYEHRVVLAVEDGPHLFATLEAIQRCVGSCEGIGLSGTFSLIEEFVVAYEQAVSAVRLGGSLGMTGPVYAHDKLRAYEMIERLSQHEDISAYVEPGVLLVRAYDEENGTELSETLRVFVDTGRNMNACARRLYTHRNTIHYRLKRVYELLGVEHIDDELAFSIALSFHVLRMLDAQKLVTD
ncbi:MAG: helix-turn-helix domain-containing protein [Coriobacteriales bacterium]|nr:helix-turn-helix domain-containing protein [Coriobacteriales bacterium]